MWPEITQAETENRRELKLSGAEISERISSNGLDRSLFSLTSLNLLNISDTVLTELPVEISNLTNLQTLLLYGNEIKQIPSSIGDLKKLKVLDISRNKLESVPDAITELTSLTTLNLSCNALTEFPALENSAQLSVLDLSRNKLTEFPSICFEANSHIAEVNFKDNEIEVIPFEIENLSSLKHLILVNNKIKKIPKCLSDMAKLKDLELIGNPVADKRLKKLIEQCRTKQVLDYVKQHGEDRPKSNENEQTTNSKSKSKKSKNRTKSEEISKHTIKIVHHTDNTVHVIYDDLVKETRPYALFCIAKNVNLSGGNYRKFLQIQTKIHDEVCVKREKATIATHDLKKLPVGENFIRYTAKEPQRLRIHPLGKMKKTTAQKLYDDLKAEAEALRKEKKRNVYSGIHKYLYLLENKTHFACVEDSAGNVISLPPLTNGDPTKISPESTEILIEVTSSSSATDCRLAMEELLKKMLLAGLGDSPVAEGESSNLEIVHQLIVEQIKVVDDEGNFRSTFPSKSHLIFDESNKIYVDRE